MINQRRIEHKLFGGITILLVSIALFPLTLSAEELAGVPRNQQQIPGAMEKYAPGAIAPGIDPFSLLTNSEEVKQDLVLTKVQLHKLSSISGNFRTQMRSASFGTKKEVQRQTQAGKRMIGKILNRQQIDRFKQIMLQVEGVCGISANPQILDRLNIKLGSSQFKDVERVCQDITYQVHTLVNASTKVSANDSCKVMSATWQQSQKIRDTGLEQVKQFLAASQRQALNAMVGQIITLSLMNETNCNQISRS